MLNKNKYLQSYSLIKYKCTKMCCFELAKTKMRVLFTIFLAADAGRTSGEALWAAEAAGEVWGCGC